jgi:hypothetical protein
MLEIQPSNEQVFTPEELAKLWKLHGSTVRKRFVDEPGVLRFAGHAGRRGRRSYFTLRIPASVAARVFRAMTVGNGGRAA